MADEKGDVSISYTAFADNVLFEIIVTDADGAETGKVKFTVNPAVTRSFGCMFIEAAYIADQK